MRERRQQRTATTTIAIAIHQQTNKTKRQEFTSFYTAGRIERIVQKEVTLFVRISVLSIQIHT